LGVIAFILCSGIVAMKAAVLTQLVSLLLVSSATHAAYVTINTEFGPITGLSDEKKGIAFFHDVPFGKPPVGDLRFRAPQMVDAWTEVQNCTYPDVLRMCPQLKVTDKLYVGTEDCLYLHVYTPWPLPSEKLPVMFWIFGGGYRMGDGYELGFYDASNFVQEHNVIVVAPNYRLNSFGFLALKALQAEDPDGSTGNYGLQDQRLAMQWTQQTISSFGGDPTQVTIYGESAGAFSVCAQLASPLSKGLYRAAILESGTCDSNAFFQPYDYATEFGAEFATACGCNTSELTDAEVVSCLRSLTTAELQSKITDWLNPHWPLEGLEKAMSDLGIPTELFDSIGSIIVPPVAPVMPFGPAIDGSKNGLPDVPMHLIEKGEWAQVPVIMGINKNEGAIFVPMVPFIVQNGVTWPLTESGIEKTLTYLFNDTVKDQVLEVYKKEWYESNDFRAEELITDFMFRCSTHRLLQAVSSQGFPAYTYIFEYPMRWIDGLILGNYHASELFFTFGNEWPPFIHDYDDKDRQMAATFGIFWSNFAKSLNPNEPVAPVFNWDKFSSDSNNYASMTVPGAMETGFDNGKCDFWNGISLIWNVIPIS